MEIIMFSRRFGLNDAVTGGINTMTRRIVNGTEQDRQDPRPEIITFDPETGRFECGRRADDGTGRILAERTVTPRFKEDEVVAVAQSYHEIIESLDDDDAADFRKQLKKLNIGTENGGWTNKMFVLPFLMPWRIQITKVRMERLQDISESDCLREGIRQNDLNPGGLVYSYTDNTKNIDPCFRTPREAFAHLIDAISGKGTWNSNPLAVAYEFTLRRNGEQTYNLNRQLIGGGVKTAPARAMQLPLM